MKSLSEFSQNDKGRGPRIKPQRTLPFSEKQEKQAVDREALGK